VQAEPLCCVARRTPPRVSAAQECLLSSSELHEIVDCARDFCGRNRQTPSKTILKESHRFLIISSLLLFPFAAGFSWEGPAKKSRTNFLGMALAHPLLGDSTCCSAAKALSLLACLSCAREQGMAAMVDARKARVCSLRNTFVVWLQFAGGWPSQAWELMLPTG